MRLCYPKAVNKQKDTKKMVCLICVDESIKMANFKRYDVIKSFECKTASFAVFDQHSRRIQQQ